MNEMINEFIGKECLLYTSSSVGSMTGTITSVKENWITVKTADSVELVNLDYVIRVKEYPVNKNGKKKKIVF